jgi:hypothetical protein
VAAPVENGAVHAERADFPEPPLTEFVAAPSWGYNDGE